VLHNIISKTKVRNGEGKRKEKKQMQWAMGAIGQQMDDNE